MDFQMLCSSARVFAIWKGAFVLFDFGVGGVFMNGKMTASRIRLAAFLAFKWTLQLSPSYKMIDLSRMGV